MICDWFFMYIYCCVDLMSINKECLKKTLICGNFLGFLLRFHCIMRHNTFARIVCQCIYFQVHIFVMNDKSRSKMTLNYICNKYSLLIAFCDMYISTIIDPILNILYCDGTESTDDWYLLNKCHAVIFVLSYLFWVFRKILCNISHKYLWSLCCCFFDWSFGVICLW